MQHSLTVSHATSSTVAGASPCLPNLISDHVRTPSRPRAAAQGSRVLRWRVDCGVDVGVGTHPLDHPAILQLVLGATRWLIIPTKSDRSSIGNVRELATEMEAVRHTNPHIEVLGVVPFDFDRQATRILRNAVEDIETVLDGAASLFLDDAGEVITIRHSSAAIDARTAGKLVHELAEIATEEEAGEPWWKALQEGRRPERIPGSVGALADDHLLLTNAIITRIGKFEDTAEQEASA